MGMLTKEDLGQIGTLLVENNKVLKAEITKEIVASEERVVDKVIECVGEMVEHDLFPKFDDLEDKIAALPSKEYIDEKLGGMRGEFNLVRRGAGI